MGYREPGKDGINKKKTYTFLIFLYFFKKRLKYKNGRVNGMKRDIEEVVGIKSYKELIVCVREVSGKVGHVPQINKYDVVSDFVGSHESWIELTKKFNSRITGLKHIPDDQVWVEGCFKEPNEDNTGGRSVAWRVI